MRRNANFVTKQVTTAADTWVKVAEPDRSREYQRLYCTAAITMALGTSDTEVATLNAAAVTIPAGAAWEAPIGCIGPIWIKTVGIETVEVVLG